MSGTVGRLYGRVRIGRRGKRQRGGFGLLSPALALTRYFAKKRRKSQRGGFAISGLALGGLGATLAKSLAGTAASTLIPAVGKAIVSGFKRPPRYRATNPTYHAKEKEMAGRAGKLLADRMRQIGHKYRGRRG
jgi:hypothetical protein